MDDIKTLMIKRESSLGIWCDLKSVLPQIASELEANIEDLDLLDYYSFPNEYMSGNLRDKPYKATGIIDGLPFVKRRRLNAKTPMGWGLVFYKSTLDPSLKYCLYINQGSYGDEIYMIAPSKDLFLLTRYAWRLTKKANNTAVPPVLEEGILDDVIRTTVGFIKNAKKIEKYGVKIKRGILLDGPPGNGKTMLCRYIQKLCSQNGIRWGTVTSADIDKAYGERELQDLFQRFTVTFFDDIDIGYMNRAKGNGRMACALLTAMDGIVEADHIVRIFTTNEKLNDMDPAFTRPGRIDRCITVRKPTRDLRSKLIDEHWPQEIKDNIDVDYLLEESDGYSFAELEAIRSFLVTNKILGDETWNLDKALAEFDERQQEEKENLGFQTNKKGKRKTYQEKKKARQQRWDDIPESDRKWGDESDAPH